MVLTFQWWQWCGVDLQILYLEGGVIMVVGKKTEGKIGVTVENENTQGKAPLEVSSVLVMVMILWG